MITICVHCDQCAAVFVGPYEMDDDDTIIQAAKRAGWQVPRDKDKANDTCPVCVAKHKKSVYYP